MAAGPLSAPQRTTPLREEADWRDLPRAPEWGRKGREEKRGAPGLSPPSSREQHRLGEGVQLAGPRGRGRLRDPRPPRPRSAPPPSPVPRRPAVPRFSRRTRTGQARDSGSSAGWRAARGGPGAGGGVLSCRPAPRRPAPSEARPAPAPGLSRNNLLEAVDGCPQPAVGSPRPWSTLVSAGPPSRAKGRVPASPSPTGILSRSNRPRMGGRAPDTQLLR